MAKVIGIDLGTTNSCMAFYENGKAKIIENKENQKTTPSIVAFDKDGKKLVGELAKRQQSMNPKRTISSIKREMGQNYHVEIDGKQLSPQLISSMILQKLKNDAEAYLQEEVNQAVITVPAYFNDAQRQATKDAGKIAGLEVLRIINEPTAAALAYGLENAYGQKVMVFDLGGGTFDVSIIEIGSGVIEVLSTAGDNHLGGDDFNKAICDFILESFLKQEGIDLRKDTVAYSRVLEASEQAKIELSSQSSTLINLPFIYQDTKENEILDYTGYVTNHLFDSSHTKSDFEHPYQILKASTIQEQVVFDINTLLKENALRDFVIYYPNDDYYRHLCRILDQFNLAYNRKETITNQAFQVVNMLLQYCLSKDETYLLDANSSLYLLNFQDHQYVSYLKNLYTLQGFIDDENYLALKKAVLKIQGHDLSSYSLSLIDFIEHSFCKNELVYALLSNLKLEGTEPLSLKEYLSLLHEMFSKKTHSLKESYDSLYLLNYNQPYSELLQATYVYCLGLNETIIPQEFKNTNLLLNQEALALKYPTTYDALNKHQNTLRHLFSCHHQKIILSYALRDLNGGDLVVSSIIQKLTKLFTIPTFKKHILFHPSLKEDYYLKGHQDDSLSVLNHHLLVYKQSHHQVLPMHINHQHNPLSASKLEVYNQCPYKYYLQYMLKVDSINNSLIQSNEIGTLIHYVLEKNHHYFNNYQAKNFDSLKEDIHLSIQNYLKTHMLKKYALKKNQFFLKLIEDDLYNTIIVLAKQMQHGLFELSACEERVYDKIQDIELKGFIDRVDLYQNYLKVIDYKSSNKELNLELARLGFNMQMLIYLEMLSKNKNYDKGAVLYFNTKKRMLKSEISILEKQDPESFFKLYKMDGYSVDDTYLEIDHEMEQESDIIKIKLKKDGSPYSNAKIISHDELDTLLQEITLHIQSLYQQMITGDIRIYPTRSDNPNIDMHINPCRFCHYKAICNYDIFYNEDHQIELGGQNEER